MAQQMPNAVRDHLNKNFRGWKLAGSSDLCDEHWAKPSLTGRFDGNGTADFAVRFKHLKNGFVMIFPDGKAADVVTVRKVSADEADNLGMSVMEKGETLALSEDEDFADQLRLGTDALRVGPCATDDVTSYVIRSGKLVELEKLFPF